jgi:aspartate/methionine/tyrosine aminotransferase
MAPFRSLSANELQARRDKLIAALDAIRAEKLGLDLTRGKPAPDQLDLSMAMDSILDGFYLLQDGTDVRNYGGLRGIPEARAFGAEILGTSPDQVLAGGPSSLTLMYNYVHFAMHFGASRFGEKSIGEKGVDGSGQSWRSEAQAAGSNIKFLCPVPGYDRHFAICELMDIDMINVPVIEGGPDMDQVEALIDADPLIKGIWCVPKYSNPTGHTYSSATVKRLAALSKRAGPNFRVIWDNAYVVHHLSADEDQLASVYTAADEAGTADSVISFASTSKITYAGAGISFMAASEANLAPFEAFLGVQMVGFDKVNQLRHVRFLKDKETLAQHMQAHRRLLEPKFEMVQSVLTRELAGKDIATWTDPQGGYFVSLDTQPGVAGATVALAESVGVKLTPAGATFPHGRDPEDKNIRIAPTFPSIDALAKALSVLTVCLQLSTIDHLLASS